MSAMLEPDRLVSECAGFVEAESEQTMGRYTVTVIRDPRYASRWHVALTNFGKAAEMGLWPNVMYVADKLRLPGADAEVVTGIIHRIQAKDVIARANDTSPEA